MKRKQAVIVTLCAVICLTACKPTTKLEQSDEEKYTQNLNNLDIDTDHLESDLIGNITINADITPKEKYNDGLGIYEFSKNPLDITNEEAVEIMNSYFEKEELSYEDTLTYMIEETEMEELEGLYRISAVRGIDGGNLVYQSGESDADAYGTLVYHLFKSGYSIKTEEPGALQNYSDKLIQLFGAKFTNLNQDGAEYVFIKNEEDYERIESELKKINQSPEGEVDYTYDIVVNQMGKNVAKEKKPVCGVYLYETVGDSGIPIKSMARCSYKNSQIKEIPDTCWYGPGGEVFVNCDNSICAAFDEKLTLQKLDVVRYIKMEEEPLQVCNIIDAKEAIDLVCQELKQSTSKICIFSVELNYSGVIREEEDKLQDYIAPVWWINCFNVSSQSGIDYYIDAITGEVI